MTTVGGAPPASAWTPSPLLLGSCAGGGGPRVRPSSPSPLCPLPSASLFVVAPPEQPLTAPPPDHVLLFLPPSPSPCTPSASQYIVFQRTAISYTDVLVTYEDLDQLSSQLANLMIKDGITPQDVIGLYGHRSPAVVLAIMAVYKAGGAYSMMDPAYPAERIILCMEIAKPNGWLQIAAAGAPPEKLHSFLTGIPGSKPLSAQNPHCPHLKAKVAFTQC